MSAEARAENVARHISAKVDEMMVRRRMLVELAAEHHPASVRHLFYQAVVAGVPGITKNDSGYNKVQRALVELRMSGEIPFGYIVDNTRWQTRPDSYDDVGDCLLEVARLYRKNLWTRAEQQVEVWAESDSIAGVITAITWKWNVPLMVTRGYSSVTFARSAVDDWNLDGRAMTVYYIGDHDPAGLAIEAKLREYIELWAHVDVSWERVGVTWDQVELFDLPGTTPKKQYGYP